MSKQYPYGTGTVRWISTDWLFENMQNWKIKIFDVQQKQSFAPAGQEERQRTNLYCSNGT